MLLSSRKGAIADLMGEDIFTALIIVMVSGILFTKIAVLGFSDVFEKQVYAVDLGFAVDALYSVRPDVSVLLPYSVPSEFGVRIDDRKIRVYSETLNDSSVFWFSGEPLFRFHSADFLPGRNSPDFYLFKSGNNVGVSDSQRSLLSVYCPANLIDLKASVDYAEVNKLGSEVAEVVSGDVYVFASVVKKSKNVLTLYVNKNQKSELLACLISQHLIEKFPEIEGFAVVPVNVPLLPSDDWRKGLADYDVAVFVEAGFDRFDSTDKTKFGRALHEVFA